MNLNGLNLSRSNQVYCCPMEGWRLFEEQSWGNLPCRERQFYSRPKPEWGEWDTAFHGEREGGTRHEEQLVFPITNQGDGESKTYDLQKSQISCPDVVKVNFHVLPSNLGGVGWHQRFTVCLVVNNFYFKALLSCFIKAVMIFPGKQVNPHNAENQPEDKADQQHIHNGRDSANQGVDNHLCWKGWEKVSV